MLKTLIILPVKLYQWVISPLLGPHCRYFPTCSDYAAQAIETHGAIKGSLLVVKRLGRCHPLGGCGVDPVPEVKRETL